MEENLLEREILKISKMREVGVTRDDFLRELSQKFRGLPFNTIVLKIEGLSNKGYLYMEYTGPADFFVKITEKGKQRLEEIMVEEALVFDF